MAGSRRRVHSLANRYTVLVAALVAVTTLILGSALASGVYRMALREETARQRAQSELVVRDVSGRLQASYRVLRTLSDRTVVRGVDPWQVGKALASAYVSNAQYLRAITLIDLDATSTVTYPPDSQIPASDVVRSITTSDGAAYVWVPPSDGEPGSLWVAVATRLEGGHDALLMGAVRTSAIDETLAQVSFSERRPTALIVDTTGRALFSAGDPQAYLGSTITFKDSADSPATGVAQLRGASGQRFAGVFADITGLAGLQWRVVVAEPTNAVGTETWQAVRAAALAWAAASLLALLLSLASVSLVARPLRMLDERARAAASGAILEPLPVNRDDEIGRLIESFNSVALRLNRMHDMTQLLASSSDLDEVLDRILVSLSHILGARDVDILLLEDDGSTLCLVRAAGSLTDAIGTTVLTADSPWLRRAVSSREIERFAGSAADDALVRLHRPGSRSACGLAVPLAKGPTLLGIVAIVCDEKRDFTEAEAEVARSFAAQASVALDNARLFDEERRSRRDAESLRLVAEIMGGPGPLRESLEGIASIEAEMLGADLSWVFLAPTRVLGAHDADPMARVLFDFWTAMQSERALPTNAVPVAFSEGDEDDRVRALLGQMMAHTLVVTPVTVNERLEGLMVLGWSERVYELDRHGAELGLAIGQQVGLALENATLFEQARVRASNLETIFRISQAVSSSLQSKVVLNRVLDVVLKILAADAVMLMTLDAERALIVVPMARGILNPEMLQMEFRPGADLPGEVFASKEPMRVRVLRGAESRLARIAAGQDLGSGVFVPLLARGRSIGVVAVFAREEDAFSDDDVEILRTFATQAALAIDTANLFSREHYVATVLQQSILPTRLPTIPGVEASSVYLPAGTEVDIGGDYYDLFVAPDGRVVLAIGDVCGKGVEAATKTSMIRYSIRGMVAAGAKPAEVLADLNAALVAEGDPSDIVTLWLGFLDVDSGRLSWANGGHPPTMLLQPQRGEIVRLGTTGALLGAIRGAAYSESHVTVEPGGTILLYTDGVTEARNRGRFFGEGRVRRALRQGGSAAAVTQRMLSLVQRFSHGELRDDAAILTVVRKPREEESTNDVSTS